MFDTDRLKIRAFSAAAGDMKHLMDLANDLEIQDCVSDDYAVPRSDSYEETIKARFNNLFYGIITTKDGEFVGSISLMQRTAKNREAMLTITLAKPYWDQGYGTEAMKAVIGHAFKSMGLHRVVLFVFMSNRRAQAAYKKLGFIEEGRMREARLRDGEWEDVIMMSILENEWKALSKQGSN